MKHIHWEDFLIKKRTDITVLEKYLVYLLLYQSQSHAINMNRYTKVRIPTIIKPSVLLAPSIAMNGVSNAIETKR